MATWWVVSTVRDDERRLIAQADLCLSQGASGVTYFLDAPEDPFPERLARLPGVEIITCDDDYWRGVRPEIRVDRQYANALAVFRRRPADWLLHIDSDEALMIRRPVGDALDAAPKEAAALRVPVLERMSGPDDPGRFDGLYRRTLDGNRTRKLKQIYRSNRARYLRRGLLGHNQGKSFFRTGFPGLRPGNHGPNEFGGEPFVWRDAEDVFLLHAAFEDWRRIERNVKWRIREYGDDLIRPHGWSGGIYNLAADIQAGRKLNARAVFDEIVNPPKDVKDRLIREGLAEMVSVDPPVAKRAFRAISLAAGAYLSRRRKQGDTR